MDLNFFNKYSDYIDLNNKYCEEVFFYLTKTYKLNLQTTKYLNLVQLPSAAPARDTRSNARAGNMRRMF